MNLRIGDHVLKTEHIESVKFRTSDPDEGAKIRMASGQEFAIPDDMAYSLTDTPKPKASKKASKK